MDSAFATPGRDRTAVPGDRLNLRAARGLVGRLCLVLAALGGFGAGDAEAAIKTWDGGGANTAWATLANWSGDTLPQTTDDVLFASAFTSGTAITNANNTTINSLTIDTGTSFSLTSTKILTLSSGSFTRTTTSSGTQTLATLVALGANGIWAINGSGKVVVSSAISGAFTLTKSGTGLLELSAANTFTGGGLVVNAGTVRGTGNAAAFGAGGLTLNGGNVELANDTAVNFGDATTISTSGTIFSERVTAGAGLTHTLGTLSIGAQTLTLATDSTVTSGTAGLTFGNVTLSANGATFVSSATNTLLTLGAVSGAGLGFTVDGAGSTTISGVIGTTTGGLTKTGAGTLTLSAANTFSGTTTLSSGTLVLGNSGALANSTLDLGTGAAGTLSFGALTTGSIGALTGTNGLALVNAGSGAVNLAIGGASQTSSYVGVLSGAGSLTKVGTGTLTLTTANTYTGTTAVSAGVLNVQNSSALGTTGTGVTVASGAALELQGASLTGKPLSLAGTGIASGGALRNVSGTNTYGGAITLGADGTRINADADLLTVSGGIGGSGFNVVFGGAGNINVAGVIATGAATLTKDGSGTLTLSAANTYTGLTTISGGTLRYGVANAISSGGITLSGGAVLNLDTFSDTVGTVTLTDGNIIGTGTLTSTANFATTTGTISASLAGTGFGITQAASGTTVLAGANTFTGATTISGVLFVQNSDALGTTAGNTTVSNGGALWLAGNIAVGAEPLSIRGVGINTTGAMRNVSGTNSFAGAVTQAAAARINSDAGLLTLSGNVGGAFLVTLGGDGDTTVSGTITASAVTKDGAGTLTLSAANTYTGLTTLSGGTLRYGISNALSTGGITISGGAVLDLASFSDSVGAVTLTEGNILGSGTLTSTANYTTTTGTISAPIGGAVGLDQQASGTTVLTAANSFSGASTIAAGGVLDIRNSNALGTASNLTFTSGGQLRLNGDISVGARPISLVGTGINATGAILNVSGTNTYGGLLTLGGATRINSDAGTLILDVATGNAIVGTNDAMTFGGAGNVAVNDPISNTTATLTKDGAGTLTLAASNTYSGVTTINAGSIRATTSVNALGSGGLTLGGGNLELANDSGLNYARNTTVSTSGTVSSERLTTGAGVTHTLGTLSIGAQTLTLATDASVTSGTAGLTFGAVTLSAAGATFNANAGTLLTLAGVSGNTFGFTVGGAGDTTISAAIATTTGGLTKTGAGTLTLSAANTFTGTTTLSSGTLLLGNAGALASSTLDLGTGPAGTLSFGALTTGSIGGLTGTNGLALVNASSGAVNLVVGGTSQTFSYSGVLSGAGSLTKVGTGSLTLGNANTYTGTTAILSGTVSTGSIVVAANASALGNASTAVTLGDATNQGSLSYTGNTATYTRGLALGAGGGRLDVTTAGQTLTVDTGGVTGSGLLTIGGTGNVVVTAALQQSAGLTKDGEGTLTLAAANTYTGTTTVSAGALNVQNATALGATTAGVAVATGAALELQGGIAVGAEPLSIAGTGVTSGGALRNVSGSNTYGGGITQTAATQINSDADLLTLSGTIGGAFNLAFGGAGNVTASNVIGIGAGTLTKSGAGTLTLSAANTYTGATSVSAGVLNVQNATGLGTTAGGVTVSSGAALELQGGITVGAEALSLSGSGISGNGALRNVSGTNAYGGAITQTAATQINSDADLLTLSGTIGGVFNLTFGGAGSVTTSNTIGIGTATLTKTGAGTLTLSATNTYTGLTTISGGTLRYGVANAISTGGITLTTGATLDLSTFSDSVGTVTLSDGNIVGTGTLTSTANYATTSGTISAPLAGTVGLVQSGNGTTVLSASNSFSGTTTLTSGTLLLANSNALANSVLNVGTGAAGTISFGDLTTASIPGLTGTNGLILENATSNAVNLVIGGTTQVSSYSGVLSGAGSLTKVGTGALTLSGQNTYTGTTAILSGTVSTGSVVVATGASGLGNASSAVTLGDAATQGVLSYTGNSATYTRGFTLGAGGGRLDVTTAGQTLTVDTADVTGAGLLTVGGAGNVAVTAVLQQSAGLTKDGSGTLTLAAANTYSGATTVSAGVLNVQNATGLGTTAAGVSVTSGAALELQGGITVGAEALSIAGTGIASGGALRNVSGTNIYGGGITQTAATQINADAGLLTLSGTIGGAFNLTFGGAGSVTASNVIGTGAGTLTKSGAGTLTLSAANTYTGATSVSAGVLNVQNATGLGTTAGGVTVTSGAALELQGGITVGAEALSLAGTGISSGGALRNVSGTNAYGGVITLGAASSITADADLLTINSAGNITGNFGLTFGGNGNIVLADPFAPATAAQTLTKTGAGTLTLSAANTYTGLTTISGGTLRYGIANALSTGGVTLQNGASLDLDTFSDTVGTVTLTDGNIVGTGTLTSTANYATTSGTISAPLAGTVGLVQSGNGTTVLSASNAFSGTTTLTSGTLLLANSNALANSVLNVGTGAAGTISFGSLTSISIPGLTGTNGLALVNASSDAVNLSIGGASQTSSYSGALSGAGSLTKVGTGNLTLGSANTYTGTTAILSGTVSTGSLVVASGASGLGNASTAVTLGDAATQGVLSYTGNTATYTRGFTLAAGGGRLDVTTTGQTLTVDTGNVTGSGLLTVGGAGNVAVTAALQQSAGLTKDGSGTLTLSAANTYTGATTVSAGVLNVQNATGLGTTAAGVTVASGAALELQGGIAVGAEALSIAGPGISSGGALRNVSGTNIYGGGITQTAATQINSDAGLLTLSGTIGGAFNLTFGGAGSVTASNVIGTGAGTLTKSGAGTLTLSAANTYTGLTTISGGTLRYGIADAISSGGITLQNGATLDIDTFNDSVGTVTLTSGNIIGSGTLTSSAQYSMVSGTVSASLAGTSGFAKTNSGTTVLTGSNSFSGGVGIANGGILLIANSFALGSTGNTVTLTAGGGALPSGELRIEGNIAIGANPLKIEGYGLGATSASLRNLSGTNSMTGSVTLTDDTRISSDAGELTLSGLVSGAFILNFGGAGDTIVSNGISAVTALNKAGTGRLTLSGSNSFTATAAISAGVVRATNSNALGTVAGATTVTSGAALELAGNVAVGAEPLSLAGMGISTGGALRNVSGTNSFAGAITQTAASQINSDAGLLTLSGAIGGGFGLTFGGAGNVTASGVIGASTLTKDGSGTLTVSGSNTYTGATTVSAGVLNVRNATGLGTTAGGVTVASGAALELQGGIAVGAEALSIAGTGISSGGALRNVSGTNSYAGAITQTAATLVTADAGQLTLSGAIGGGFGIMFGGAGNTIVSGTIATGANGLTKTGAGTLTLSAANTYAGATDIQSGTLRLGLNSAISGSSAITIGSAGSTATLDVSNHALTISSLTFAGQGGTLPDAAGTVTLQNLATGTALINVLSGTANEFHPTVTLSSTTVIDVTSGAAFLLHASLYGSAPLTKSGVGLLEIFGNNEAYTGPISLTGGTTTLLGGNSTLGTGTTTVYTGATLDFNNRPFTGSYVLAGGTAVNISSGSTQIVISGTSTITGSTSAADYTVTSTGSAAFDVALDSLSAVTVDLGGQATFNDGVAGLVDAHGTSTFNGNVLAAANVQVGLVGQSGAVATFAGNVGTTVTVNGGALATFTGTVAAGISTTGTIDITGHVTSAGGLTVGAGGVGRLLDGAAYDAADIETAGSLVVNRTANLTLSAAIDGVGSLTKQGGSTLTLTGTSSFSGGSTISAGTVALSGAGALASQGAVSLAAATALDISAAAGSRTIGALSGTAGSQVILGGNSLTAGDASNTTFAGTISGSGGFTKAGAGTLTVTGSQTYTALTAISAGTLALSGAGNIQSSSGVNLLESSAAFSVASASGNRTIGSLAGVAGSSILLGGNDLTAGGAANTAFAGVISGSGGFTKVGSGILELAGVNTFSGQTTVEAGKMLVNGSLASSVYVAAGATLGGSGTIGGFTSIAGVHAPGNSPGLQTFTDGLTYGGTSTFQWELAANTAATGDRGVYYDGVDVTGGNLQIDAGAAINLIFNGAGSTVDWSDAFWDVNHQWTAIAFAGMGTSTGNFTIGTIGNDINGNPIWVTRPAAYFSVQRQGDNVIVAFSAPEPGAISIAAIGLGILGWRLRRRTRAKAA